MVTSDWRMAGVRRSMIGGIADVIEVIAKRGHLMMEDCCSGVEADVFIAITYR